MNITRWWYRLKNKFVPHRPTVEVIISRSALLYNLHTFKQMYPNAQFAPVLKSNAYGHGLVEVARIVEHERVPFLVVDSLYEARVLRSAGVRAKILVIGYTPNENILATADKKISFTLTSLVQIETLAAVCTRSRIVHVKVDTGMHRQGILPHEIPAAIAALKSNPRLYVEGVCSHLANAHDADESLVAAPMHEWLAARALFAAAFSSIVYFHLTNTAGTRHAAAAQCNVVRLGIGLHGYNTSRHTKINLRPSLRLETVVSGVKILPPGAHVGYNNAFTAARESKIATIPVGYFEGIDRRLSNKGVVRIKNTDCPIVGVISMNITSVDVTDVPGGVKLGDRVVVISDVPEHKNSEVNISRDIGEIPYVVLARIPEHLRRQVVE